MRVIDAADGPSTSRGNLEIALFAADTIARQFGANPDTGEQLADRPLSTWELGRIAALCRGWPGHPALPAAHTGMDTREPTWADRELRYALLPANVLADEVQRDIKIFAAALEDQTFLLTGPLSARLRRDPDAVHEFAASLDAATDPTLKAAIPSALTIAGVLTQAVADWCSSEIERQLHSERAELGYDIQTGSARGVAAILLDILQGNSG